MIKISEKLWLGPQPAAEGFAPLRAAGFARVINDRPPGEQAGLADERQKVEAAGLSYAAIPVTVADITEGDVRAFQAAVAGADGPVFAHCKTGARAALLYGLGEILDQRLTLSGLVERAAGWGLDLSAASPWLAREANRVGQVRGFYDPRTGSLQYVVADPVTRFCAIIDPVLDFDEKSGATATASADAILAHVAQAGLRVAWILDTHPHADHFSAAGYLQRQTGAPTAIGAEVVAIQKIWREIYNWPDLPADGRQWNRLFADGETFMIGSLPARAIHSPGHTLASVTYVIGDAAFVHDTLFMPDSGTARADFPGGSAGALWDSIQALLALPETMRLFTGHDYQPGGRAVRFESTVAAQKAGNSHLVGQDRDTFIALREARDRSLPMPNLILHALQVNLAGGNLPEPENNGRSYLKFPIDALSFYCRGRFTVPVDPASRSTGTDRAL